MDSFNIIRLVKFEHYFNYWDEFGQITYINPRHVVQVFEADLTIIVLSSDSYIKVKEKPKEVFEKLYAHSSN